MERRLAVSSRDPSLPLEGTVIARLLLLSLLVLSALIEAHADIIRVPADYPFREALWSAESGDTVLVAAGWHHAFRVTVSGVDLVIISESGADSTVLGSIGSGGAQVTLYSGDYIVRGFTFDGGPKGPLSDNGLLAIRHSDSAVIEDCRFVNAYGFDAALMLSDVTAHIVSCDFVENLDGGSFGGAIWSSASVSTIEDCTFRGNSSSLAGGAIKASGTCRIDRCTFSGNVVYDYNYHAFRKSGGGAIAIRDGELVVTNSTFEGHRCAGYGGAIYAYEAETIVRESIFWGNEALLGGNEIYLDEGSTLDISCSNISPPDIEGEGAVVLGPGNQFADPQFLLSAPHAPTPAGDHRLRPTSPCLAVNAPCGRRMGSEGPLVTSTPSLNLFLATPSYSGCDTPENLESLSCSELLSSPIAGSARLWVVATRQDGFPDGVSAARFGLEHDVTVQAWNLCTGGEQDHSPGWPSTSTGIVVSWPDSCYVPPGETAVIGYFDLVAGDNGSLHLTPDPRVDLAKIADCDVAWEPVSRHDLGQGQLAVGITPRCGIGSVDDVSAEATGCEVSVSWGEPEGDATGFRVERSGISVFELGASARSAQDSVGAGVPHSYSVRPIRDDAIGIASPGLVAGARPWAPSMLMDLNESPFTHPRCDGPILTWQDHADDASYEVWRSLGGYQDEHLIAELPANTTSFQDTTLASHSALYYVGIRGECGLATSNVSSGRRFFPRPPYGFNIGLLDTTLTRWHFSWSVGETGPGAPLYYNLYLATTCYERDQETLVFQVSDRETTMTFPEPPFDGVFAAWAHGVHDPELGCGESPPSDCHVTDGMTPVLLQHFTGTSVTDGIRLEWRVGGQMGSETICVERRPARGGQWREVFAVSGDESDWSGHSWLDRAVPADVPVTYRLVWLDAPDGPLVLGELDEMVWSGRPIFDLSIAPTPFSPATRITFSTATDGAVRLAVYDVTGRRVRSLVDEHLPSGRHQLAWTGRDNGGRVVSPGVYFIHLRAGDQERVRRVVHSR